MALEKRPQDCVVGQGVVETGKMSGGADDGALRIGKRGRQRVRRPHAGRQIVLTRDDQGWGRERCGDGTIPVILGCRQLLQQIGAAVAGADPPEERTRLGGAGFQPHERMGGPAPAESLDVAGGDEIAIFGERHVFAVSGRIVREIARRPVEHDAGKPPGRDAAQMQGHAGALRHPDAGEPLELELVAQGERILHVGGERGAAGGLAETAAVEADQAE